MSNPPIISDVLNRCADAMVAAFESTIGVSVTAGEFTSSDRFHRSGEFTGIIELSGDLEGALTVSLSGKIARIMSAQMIGCDDSEITDEDVDGVATEVANQIAGGVRNSLYGDDFRFDISVPKFFRGDEPIEASLPNHGEWHACHVTTERSRLLLQVSVRITQTMGTGREASQAAKKTS